MVAANIKVFMRVRPSSKPSKSVTISPEESTLHFELHKHAPDEQINNTKLTHRFRFDGILPMTITQDEVFHAVAKPVIDDVLQGINGTIFAYGQTGSGKTFTITGGAERYADRGLIPRTISYVFECFRKGDANYRLYISYLEIYNDAGYDLLSREDTAQKLDDLPKVQLREDDDGNIHLRNLSVNMAQKEEDALNLLFLGDTNRVVAETPMNDASTRSHCMFILWIDATQQDSDTVRRAKLHLVDLAGSERISKTGVEGHLQKEARYINLSLHYLEQVIVALQDKSQGRRAHVPYRNSMMTSVLRDSLGGNCKTVMVGAMAVEEMSIDESITTCRFAQRVAMIKNNATINEELDPAMLIKRLKKEVTSLKDELKLLSGDGANEEAMSETDVQECQRFVLEYLEETNTEASFACGSVQRFGECFKILRNMYLQRQSQGAADNGADFAGLHVSGAQHELKNCNGTYEKTGNYNGKALYQNAETKAIIFFDTTWKLTIQGALDAWAFTNDETLTHHPPSGEWQHRTDPSHAVRVAQSKAQSKPRRLGVCQCSALEAEVLEMRQQVLQRDEEVTMLLNSLGKRSRATQVQTAQDGRIFIRGRPPKPGELPGTSEQQPSQSSTAPVECEAEQRMELSPEEAVALLADRNKAFDMFRKSVRRSESLDDNKESMKRLHVEAQGLGEKANGARAAINVVKTKVEKLRMERALSSSPRSPDDDLLPDGPEALALLKEIEGHKRVYQQSIQRLSQVKSEIDHYKRVADQNKQRLQKDFELWFKTTVACGGGVVVPSDLSTTCSSQGSAASRASSLPAQSFMEAPVSSHPLPAADFASARARHEVTSDHSSRVSEADLSARPTPEPAIPVSTPVISKRHTQTGGAWVEPPSTAGCHAMPVSTNHFTQSDRRDAPSRPSASGPALPANLPTSACANSSIAPPALLSAAPVTGDAAIDDEIAKYYAAIAELQR